MPDNLFDSGCDAIVNTVNCVGVMGGGLAKRFRLRYPEMNAAYQAACANRLVQIGKMWNWFDQPEQRWIINFPTKQDWRDPSTLDYVADGLADLRLTISDLKPHAIAVPALGCGLGGLQWMDVQPLIHKFLLNVPTQVIVYPPEGSRYTLGES